MYSSKQKKQIFTITKISKEHCLKSNLMKLFISESTEEINIDGMINLYIVSSSNKSIPSFHSNFYKFKQALNFKRVHRKTKIDSILKKCKSKFFRTVQEAIKELLEDYVPMPRLPQEFITNINIDVNKKYLNYPFETLLREFDRTFDLEMMLMKLPYHKHEIVRKFMSMSLQMLFNGYINSRRFQDDCNVIREKEGEKFELLFRYVSKIFVSYYSISKGNKSKHKVEYGQDLLSGKLQYHCDSLTEVPHNY